MRITLEEVRRIARLAHLQFSDDALERLRGQLDQILDYITVLDRMDVSGVATSSGPAGPPPAGGPLREDVPGPTLSPEDALSNAPESGEGHFTVPRVIT